MPTAGKSPEVLSRETPGNSCRNKGFGRTSRLKHSPSPSENEGNYVLAFSIVSHWEECWRKEVEAQIALSLGHVYQVTLQGTSLKPVGPPLVGDSSHPVIQWKLPVVLTVLNTRIYYEAHGHCSFHHHCSDLSDVGSAQFSGYFNSITSPFFSLSCPWCSI